MADFFRYLRSTQLSSRPSKSITDHHSTWEIKLLVEIFFRIDNDKQLHALLVLGS